MRKLAFLCLAFALVAVSIYGCDETNLTEPSSDTAGNAAEEVISQTPLLSPQNGKAVLPFWATSGNANTQAASHFLGTLDNQPLVLKASGVEVMRVTPNRSVGINTAGPAATLHIRKGTQRHELMVQETNVGAAATIEVVNTSRTWTIESDASPDRFRIINYSGPARGEISILAANGYVGIGEENPGYPLEMRSGAYVTAGGVWTDASSRAYKENIRELTIADARTTLEGLTPVHFNYKVDKDEGYVGFIAEDVPDLVATQDRKGLGPMDIVAVLTKVVQQQEEKIAELEVRLDAMQ